MPPLNVNTFLVLCKFLIPDVYCFRQVRPLSEIRPAPHVRVQRKKFDFAGLIQRAHARVSPQ